MLELSYYGYCPFPLLLISMKFKHLAFLFPFLGKKTYYALLTKRNYNSTEGIETPQRVK